MYNKALQLTPQVAELRHAQRRWLHHRDACIKTARTHAVDCIRDAYQQRITTLQVQMYPAPVPDAPPMADGVCGADWNRHIESLVHTGDGAAHGPDWGSEEWRNMWSNFVSAYATNRAFRRMTARHGAATSSST